VTRYARSSTPSRGVRGERVDPESSRRRCTSFASYKGSRRALSWPAREVIDVVDGACTASGQPSSPARSFKSDGGQQLDAERPHSYAVGARGDAAREEWSWTVDTGDPQRGDCQERCIYEYRRRSQKKKKKVVGTAHRPTPCSRVDSTTRGGIGSTSISKAGTGQRCKGVQGIELYVARRPAAEILIHGEITNEDAEDRAQDGVWHPRGRVHRQPVREHVSMI